MVTLIYRKKLLNTKKILIVRQYEHNTISAKYSWQDVLVRIGSKFYKHSRTEEFSDSFHLSGHKLSNLRLHTSYRKFNDFSRRPCYGCACQPPQTPSGNKLYFCKQNSLRILLS